MKMEYFGTALDCAGHFFWELKGSEMHQTKQWFDKIPFNPEDMPRHERPYIRRKGEAVFYCENGYSILAIEGAPADTRWGSKSVFFLKEVLTKEEMINKIYGIPIAVMIIDTMPFEVDLSVSNKDN
jgi:hypothetical protein